ncbi:MAG: 1,4-alpha-glucan branching protein GlgB [Porcipelethomonas sp.]
MNMQEFYDGKAFDAYEYFGAHKENGKIIFRTFAPAAKRVAIFGSFNNWTEEEMTRETEVYTFVSDTAKFGDMYKYVIYTADGQRVEHCDPYGFGMELRPNFASYIVDLSEYKFTDSRWMKNRTKNYNTSMNIYEVHLGSWRTKERKTDENGEPRVETGWYTYSEIADELISYVKQNNFTHIEFLPLSEHPADCSWGYQNTGFFAPTSRYGTAAQLKELINKCHNAGIGVILDFVLVHFAVDGYGLAKYDGTPLYEYPSSDVGYSEWGTCNFNFARREACSFMQSAANFWLKEFHFDGLRMDAISRAIYWMGDPERGVNENNVAFIRNMNTGLHAMHPTAMLIAEDSTSYLKVTAPVEYDGLGFDYKWDMGWMNDTLDFFRIAPWERKNHYHKLTFSMAYFYNELFMLPVSHDETVHGKASVIQKMYGDYDEKLPECRAFYMYMYTHPGKKLTFMGNEFGQFREWDENREQDWDILRYPVHDSFRKYLAELSRLYISRKCLYDAEYNMQTFKWLVAHACEQCVYVYERSSGESCMICALNLSGMEQTITFNTGKHVKLKEAVNSCWEEYGGNVKRDGKLIVSDEDHNITLTLEPMCGRLFDVSE